MPRPRPARFSLGAIDELAKSQWRGRRLLALRQPNCPIETVIALTKDGTPGITMLAEKILKKRTAKAKHDPVSD